MRKRFEAEEFFFFFTRRGFVKTRNLINYVFPKQDMETPGFINSRWLRRLGYVSPLICLIMLVGLIAWPIYLASMGFMGITISAFTVAGVACFRSLYVLCVASGLAIIAKFKKRNASGLLATTLITPTYAIVALASVTFFGNLLIPNSDLLVDRGQCRLVKKAYEKSTVPENRIPEKYWGFTPGKDSYDEVTHLLILSGAKFDTFQVEGRPNFYLYIDSYEPFLELGHEIKAHFSFDKNRKLKELILYDDEDKIEPSKLDHLKDVFYTKYSPFMKQAKLDLSKPIFITPHDVKIEIKDESITLTAV